MSNNKAVAWINERGAVYLHPSNTYGLRPLVYGDVGDNGDAKRYQVFRDDILTKDQKVMSMVAELLPNSPIATTPEMVDQAFNAAIARYL